RTRYWQFDSGLVWRLAGEQVTMRTLVNVRSGGKNRISGYYPFRNIADHRTGLGLTVSPIPKFVPAGILITAGIGISDYKSLKHISKIPRTDAVDHGFCPL
ncbi:MAG: hypothetical protein IPO69_02480, partial [Saprospiraceae bacterium]|nr:hypothetical protein [Saprospiraceae bacterium]